MFWLVFLHLYFNIMKLGDFSSTCYINTHKQNSDIITKG